jgi:hypothetical protein
MFSWRKLPSLVTLLKVILANRVTRLSDCLQTLGSFIKIMNISGQNLCATFFHGKSYVYILANYVLGYILGDFFTNSSGHLCYVEPSLAAML